MRTPIQLTWKHIREGKPGDADACPVALAVKDAGLCNLHDISVTRANITLYGKWPHRAIYKIPNTAGRIVFAVDAFKAPPLAWWMMWIVGVFPKTFYLDIPNVFLPIPTPRLRSSLLARILARAELRGLPGILRNRASGRPDGVLSK